MRFLCLLLTALLWAQDSPSRRPPGPELAPEEKQLRREKARGLLDEGAKMTAAVQPQVQVAALLHIGDNYNLIDSKKALEYLEQAFAASADLPSSSAGDLRGDLQAVIVSLVADVNLEKALELLPQLAPPLRGPDLRLRPIEKVVRLLLQKNDFDRAIRAVEGNTNGDFPFRAARLIFEKLSEDDPRRVQLFGAATSGYVTRPEGPFGEFVSRHWQAVPRAQAESALRALLNSILDRKDDSFMATNISTAKGAVSFSNRQNRELFEIMHVLQAIDPKRAAELLETRPELRAAVERFPIGMGSMRSEGDDNISMTSFSGDKPPSQESQARERVRAIARARLAEIQTVMRQDPQRALALVRGIPDTAMQAQALGSIARTVSEKDPAGAQSVLDQSMRILDDIKNPTERLPVLAIVAEAAVRARQDDRAWEAIDRALADAAELYKQDTNAENPNEALREYWPSTQSYRRTIWGVTTWFGLKAEPLLVKITDPELALLARIEMAQAFLGRPTSAQDTRRNTSGRREGLVTR